ncbi:MAG TPA: ABC transporter permease [Acidimicrobiales bacterium]|nr:ABC transporter permease [Acidimicrobiales bacterium]
MIFLARWLYRRSRANRPRPSPKAPIGVRPEPEAKGNLSLVVHQAHYDMLSFFRNGQARFFTLALPVVFLVIFVSLFGSGTVGPFHAKESTYFVPGIAAMAVVSASFVNLVISVTAQREAGVLKRRRATPVPASVLIAGRALTAVSVSLMVIAVVLVIGRFAYGVDVPLQALPALALTAIIGSGTFCVLGYAVSTLIGSSDAAQPIVQATVLPLYFISGVFVPGVELPTWLQRIAEIFPVQHMADALHRGFGPAGQASSVAWGDLGALGLWVIAGLVVALRRFRWAPAAASV